MTDLYRYIYLSLDKFHQRFFFFIIVLTIIGAILEMASVAMILPLLSIIVDDQLLSNYSQFKYFFELIGSPSKKELIIYLFIILLAFYLIKAIFLTVLQWFQFKFIYSVEQNLSERLFNRYLYENYNFHINNNSAILLRNIISEISVFSSAMTGFIGVMTEIFVMIGILSIIMIFEPLLGLSIGILAFIVSSTYYLATRKRLGAWGLIRQDSEGKKLKSIQQGLGAIKDIKIYGKEIFFLDYLK